MVRIRRKKRLNLTRRFPSARPSGSTCRPTNQRTRRRAEILMVNRKAGAILPIQGIVRLWSRRGTEQAPSCRRPIASVIRGVVSAAMMPWLGECLVCSGHQRSSSEWDSAMNRKHLHTSSSWIPARPTSATIAANASQSQLAKTVQPRRYQRGPAITGIHLPVIITPLYYHYHHRRLQTCTSRGQGRSFCHLGCLWTTLRQWLLLARNLYFRCRVGQQRRRLLYFWLRCHL